MEIKDLSRVHTAEKPYKCFVCEIQFSGCLHVRNHEIIHSGERSNYFEDCNNISAAYSTLCNYWQIRTGEKQ